MAKKVKTDSLNKLIKFLSEEADKIIAEELNRVNYKNDTDNLHDSYGWGIYVNGKLSKSGYQTKYALAPRIWEREPLYGRDAITDFLERKYKPHDGIDLVIVAAMPYGQILQEKYKYEVIAIAQNQLKALSNRIKGSTFGIIKNGKY
jgi:hypothetical protein